MTSKSMGRPAVEILVKAALLSVLLVAIVLLGYWQIRLLVLFFVGGDTAHLWQFGFGYLAWCAFLLLLISAAFTGLVVMAASGKRTNGERENREGVETAER